MFDAPTLYDGTVTGPEDVLDPKWYAGTGVTVLNDGVMPYARYVIREKGKVELGNLSCSFCHTRVLPDGTVIKGGQGNFPFDKSLPFWERRRLSADQIRQGFLLLFSVPWLPDKQQFLEKMTPEEIHAAYTSVAPRSIGA